MLLKDFLPNPAFREYIQCYRIMHFKFDKNAETPFKADPPKPEERLRFFLRDGEEVELINCRRKDYKLPVVLIGQQTSVMNYCIGKNFLVFQVVFQPTGLFRLTGIPSYELTNQYLDAETIFSKNVRFVYEQLQHAKDYHEMLVIADRFVADLINHSKKDKHLLDSVSTLMLPYGGNISIDWLAKESCLCLKQFERKFNERIGVNPKIYGRIIRFIKAFNIKNVYPHWDWLRIAIECGYYDYPHLAKEYKDFTGMSPIEFHLLESDSPERKLRLVNDLYKNRLRWFSLSPSKSPFFTT